MRIAMIILYLVLAPLLGGLLDGLDRRISARMQRRVGPPVLQPFYDVQKLFAKQRIVVTNSQTFLMITYLVLMIFTGCMFYSGADMLMCFFVLSTAGIFLYFAAVVTDSPYSYIGGQRELFQEMCCEPAVLLTGVGFYLLEDTFETAKIVQADRSAIVALPGFFAAFLFILTIKMRKSPFDESTSHHPHQELVKGVTTELGALNLALFQITEWYENILMLSVIALFIINKNPWSIPAAILVVLAAYFLEILIDNTSARMKSGKMLELSWAVTIAAAGVNLLILILVR
ncbi:MAG TPA: Ech hydrogenase subunit EchB [Lachnospiraceae bacterium]|nr:Ech hydrogenase subunit EchB [Lachnospiraceae bacterium]